MRRILGFMGAFALLLSLAHGDSLAAKEKTSFRATLTGSAEVPATDTRAHGNTTLRLSRDGTELHYKLTANNISNVTAAHIHLGAVGQNGAPVAFLFGPATPGGGKKNGVLAAGTLRASDLIGPLAGKTMADLVAEIRSGNAYVNVHTGDGVGEASRVPGDFPDGEIRGQVR